MDFPTHPVKSMNSENYVQSPRSRANAFPARSSALRPQNATAGLSSLSAGLLRLGGGIAVALLPLLLPGCAGLSSQERATLDAANRSRIVGNHVDALAGFQKLEGVVTAGVVAEVPEVVAGEAESLFELGRYEEAAAAFSALPSGVLVPASVSLVEARVQRELGRRAEPSFIEDTPLNAGKIKEATRKATDHYQLARSRYGLVLGTEPSHFEARLGKAECLLRIGILSKSTQFLSDARVGSRPASRRSRTSMRHSSSVGRFKRILETVRRCRRLRSTYSLGWSSTAPAAMTTTRRIATCSPTSESTTTVEAPSSR